MVRLARMETNMADISLGITDNRLSSVLCTWAQGSLIRVIYYEPQSTHNHITDLALFCLELKFPIACEKERGTLVVMMMRPRRLSISPT